ncbi:MAG: YIP1 family protein [Candidatus Aquicultor sp.]
MNEDNFEGATESPVPGEQEKKGLFDLLYGVITKPSETFRYLIETKPVLLAFLVYVAIAWIGAIAGISGSLTTARSLNHASGSTTLNPGLIATITVIVAPILAAISLAIVAGIYHIIALILKGKGDYAGLISALGFASFPRLFAAPFGLLTLVAGAAGSIIAGIASLGFGIWFLVLDILAVRENYKFSLGRAILTVLIPVILGVILIIVVIIAVLAVVLSAVNGLKAS